MESTNMQNWCHITQEVTGSSPVPPTTKFRKQAKSISLLFCLCETGSQ